MKHTKRSGLLAAVLSLLLLPSLVHAWGGDGHQIVCLIAEDRLTPAAKAGIHALLGDANISEAEIASWADEIRRQRQETAPWHYVDIPTDAKGFDEGRDGQNGNNVIDKIADFKAVLQDPQNHQGCPCGSIEISGAFCGRSTPAAALCRTQQGQGR